MLRRLLFRKGTRAGDGAQSPTASLLRFVGSPADGSPRSVRRIANQIDRLASGPGSSYSPGCSAAQKLTSPFSDTLSAILDCINRRERLSFAFFAIVFQTSMFRAVTIVECLGRLRHGYRVRARVAQSSTTASSGLSSIGEGHLRIGARIIWIMPCARSLAPQLRFKPHSERSHKHGKRLRDTRAATSTCHGGGSCVY